MRYEVHDELGLVRKYARKRDADRHAANGGGLFVIRIKEPSRYQRAIRLAGEALI